MSDWEVIGSVRFRDAGFDVVRSNGRFFTRRIAPGASGAGPHDESAAMGLLAELARLSDEARAVIAMTEPRNRGWRS